MVQIAGKVQKNNNKRHNNNRDLAMFGSVPNKKR